MRNKAVRAPLYSPPFRLEGTAPSHDGALLFTLKRGGENGAVAPIRMTQRRESISSQPLRMIQPASQPFRLLVGAADALVRQRREALIRLAVQRTCGSMPHVADEASAAPYGPCACVLKMV